MPAVSLCPSDELSSPISPGSLPRLGVATPEQSSLPLAVKNMPGTLMGFTGVLSSGKSGGSLMASVSFHPPATLLYLLSSSEDRVGGLQMPSSDICSLSPQPSPSPVHGTPVISSDPHIGVRCDPLTSG